MQKKSSAENCSNIGMKARDFFYFIFSFLAQRRGFLKEETFAGAAGASPREASETAFSEEDIEWPFGTHSSFSPAESLSKALFQSQKSNRKGDLQKKLRKKYTKKLWEFLYLEAMLEGIVPMRFWQKKPREIDFSPRAGPK